MGDPELPLVVVVVLVQAVRLAWPGAAGHDRRSPLSKVQDAIGYRLVIKPSIPFCVGLMLGLAVAIAYRFVMAVEALAAWVWMCSSIQLE